MSNAGLEKKVISEILRQKNFRPAIKQQLGAIHFSDSDHRRIFEMIRLRYQSRDAPKTFPSIRSIRQKFPGFALVNTNEDDGELESLIKDLKYKCLANDLASLSSTVTQIIDDNEPEEALDFLRSTLSQIRHDFDRSQGTRMDEVVANVLEQYERAQTGEAFGIPWSEWDCLTRDTMGKRPGELIFIYGRAKSMKTWVGLKSCIDDFTKHKQRVLFWSREMQAGQLSGRIGSIVGEYDYQLWKSGNLPPHVWERSKPKLEVLTEALMRSDEERKRLRDRNQDDFLLFGGSKAPRDFDSLKVIVDEHEPDIIYMDSFYHMNPTRGSNKTADHERIRYLIEDMKQLALDIERPVVLIHQANREGEKTFGNTMTDFSRSDAAAAECDLALRVLRKKVSEIWEEDYEGYWDQVEQGKQVRQKRRGVRLKNVAPKPKTLEEEMVVSSTRPYNERTKAELAIMLSGSRDSVLDGFIISCNPGYEFNVIEESVSVEEVKHWFSTEEEKAEKEEKREKAKNREAKKRQEEMHPQNKVSKMGIPFTRPQR